MSITTTGVRALIPDEGINVVVYTRRADGTRRVGLGHLGRTETAGWTDRAFDGTWDHVSEAGFVVPYRLTAVLTDGDGGEYAYTHHYPLTPYEGSPDAGWLQPLEAALAEHGIPGLDADGWQH